MPVGSELKKNFGGSTDLAKKRSTDLKTTDLHTPIHPPPPPLILIGKNHTRSWSSTMAPSKVLAYFVKANYQDI